MSETIHPFSDRKMAIYRYEPVELNGLVYHPITMENYDKWQALKPVLTLRQGTLPAVYACMTFLQCVWALSIDARASNEGDIGGPWNAIGLALFLSLRLSDEDKIQAVGNPGDHRTITSIRIVKDGQEHSITPLEFNEVRRLVAEQNGAELPDEADNPDLVEAAEDIRNSNAIPLNCDMGDYMTSVASAKGIRRKALFSWTIKEFEDEVRALKRRYGFFLCSIAEGQGAKFPKGNPYPTWLFDKAKDEFAGLISMERLQAEHNASITTSETAPIQTT